jgi:hypothetical protein
MNFFLSVFNETYTIRSIFDNPGIDAASRIGRKFGLFRGRFTRSDLKYGFYGAIMNR